MTLSLDERISARTMNRPLLLVAIDSLLVEASPMPHGSDILRRGHPRRVRCSSPRIDIASATASLTQDRAIANHKIISTDNCHVWQPRGSGPGGVHSWYPGSPSNHR